MHERPAGKIGVYTRFFEYANFRLPFSTFLVDVLRDPLPKSTEFNVDHYALLVAHLAPFRKFPKPFLCLIGMSRCYTLDEDTYPRFLHDDGDGRFYYYIFCILQFLTLFLTYFFGYAYMDLFAFIHVADPTKVKVVERECAEGEVKLLDSTVGHVVPLLPVAPARAESELEASVEKLFDEGSSTKYGDSVAGGGHDAQIKPVLVMEDTAAENVTAERPKRLRKKRPAVTDASGSSHPPKKLRGDNKTSSGVATGGKSPSVLKELLASSVLNVEIGAEAAATLPFITSSISVSPRREGGDPADSITGLNLCTTGPAERFVISLDSTHHSSTNASGAEVDSIIRSAALPPVMTEAVVFVPQWNGLNDSLLDDYDVSWEFVDHLAPPALFSQIRAMDYHHLFTEFDVGTARQACLNAEVRMRTEYCLSERSRLESECKKQADLMKTKDDEIEILKARLLLKEAEATEAVSLCVRVSADEAAEKVHADEMDALKQKNHDGLVEQVHALETTCSSLRGQVSGYERLKEQIEEFQDAQMNIVNDKVAKLDADLLKMALHLEEKFYPHLLTTISGRRWLLTRGLKLAVVKCLNSPDYLTALGSAIGRAIEKRMQNGLSAGIDHGKVGKQALGVVTPATALVGVVRRYYTPPPRWPTALDSALPSQRALGVF
ncbi:hypothetical protein Tco_1158542 [Tanacetum coccineum]